MAKVEKILQGGISACVEPYMRAGENAKVRERLEEIHKKICDFIIICVCMVRKLKKNSPIFRGYILKKLEWLS